MPKIYGSEIRRIDYLRHVGDANQVFGLKCLEYLDGKAAMIRACEVDNASFMRFTVAESKGLDLLELSYKGMHYNFVSKASISSPWIADEQGMAYRGCLGAGFLYTAGLANVGGFCEEDGFYHCAHGAYKNIPARNVALREEWQGDACTLHISGDVRDAQFFGRNLLLHREIHTVLGEKRLFLSDTIENQGFAPEQLMLLYHMNLGWPILDADARLYAPILKDEPLTAHTAESDHITEQMIAPIDGNSEYLHALTLGAAQDGKTLCMFYNPARGLGLYLRYSKQLLRYLIVWKCMVSGDYALGILPSNCKPLGRAAVRKDGDAQYIEPMQTLNTELEIGIVEGEAEFSCFLEEINRIRTES